MKKIMLFSLGLFYFGCATMKTSSQEQSFIQWKPAITPEEVYKQTVSFQFLSSVDEDLFWIENRPEEKGRAVLVTKNKEGKIRDLIPSPYSARSRVFEYGGNPYTVFKGVAYFVHFSDQRIYKIDLKEPQSVPIPITIEKTKEGYLPKYAEMSVSSDGKWLAFAYEQEIPGREPKNSVGVLSLAQKNPQEAQILAEGADFYSRPKFSPDGKRISWLEWKHPYMPWDSTRLFEAQFASGKLSQTLLIAGSDSSSISESCYLETGELVYSQDFSGKNEKDPENYYNLYMSSKGKITPITSELMDYQQFRCFKNQIFAQFYKNGQPQIQIITHRDQKFSQQNVRLEQLSFTVPVPASGKIFFAGVTLKKPSQLLEMEISSEKVKIIRESTDQVIDEGNISKGVAVEFPTEDGKVSHGYFYPPKNKMHRPPKGEKPPVRVLVHGGPTSMTFLGFSKQLMFWTSQGYAVFDVNYRGSYGYGRQYRDALLKKWGLLEIQDVKDGLLELRKRQWISDKAVVSGGSAGGYTVQRLLTTYPELFASGASHFGIGNLITLQKLTHKLESHYLERLIGGTLETNLKEYKDRSPINHLEKLKSPMIIFQGSDDKVVPPENSREMAEILKSKGIRYEYYEYPEEGHGFRKKENLIDSLTKEALFFKSVLGADLKSL